MIRRSLILAAVLLLLGGAFARAAETSLDADMMRAALRTAAPEEDGFITYVLELVAEGRLPASLVHSTFLWATKKPRHRFQYFRRGLIVRAADLGYRI